MTLMARARPSMRPRVSSRPRAMFMHCTAPPAVPLVRLSTAPTATIRPADSSAVTCRCTAFEPTTDLVCGHWPAGSRCTNGSSAYALAYACWRSSAVTPSRSGAEAVARIPRGIGTSSGVKLTETGRVGQSPARFCAISGRVPVRPADGVRRGAAHHLAGQQVLDRLLARPRWCRRPRPRRRPARRDRPRPQGRGSGWRSSGSSPGTAIRLAPARTSRWPGSSGRP